MILTSRLAGATFANPDGTSRQGILSRHRRAFRDTGVLPALHLRREPENPFDRNAICVQDEDDRTVGYLEREVAVEVARSMDAGARVVVDVAEVFVGTAPHFSIGMTLRVSLGASDDSGACLAPDEARWPPHPADDPASEAAWTGEADAVSPYTEESGPEGAFPDRQVPQRSLPTMPPLMQLGLFVDPLGPPTVTVWRMLSRLLSGREAERSDRLEHFIAHCRGQPRTSTFAGGDGLAAGTRALSSLSAGSEDSRNRILCALRWVPGPTAEIIRTVALAGETLGEQTRDTPYLDWHGHAALCAFEEPVEYQEQAVEAIERVWAEVAHATTRRGSGALTSSGRAVAAMCRRSPDFFILGGQRARSVATRAVQHLRWESRNRRLAFLTGLGPAPGRTGFLLRYVLSDRISTTNSIIDAG